jgi:flagellar hook-basal body complex protein FliE
MTIIPPIQPITSAIRPVETTSVKGGADAATSADPTGGFGKVVSSALDNLDQAQKQTDSLSQAAATGDLSRVEDLMIATNQTQLMTQLTVAVRDRAVEAFTEIMRMQV